MKPVMIRGQSSKFCNFEKSNCQEHNFRHRDIHKHNWTSPDGITRNQINHVLTDKRRHSNKSDVRFFRGADCDTDHYLVVTKLRERISVSKRARKSLI
jgi:hypothetical protein